MQVAAVNELMTKATDDPMLAAELGRRLLRKWGLRLPQLANIVNEELGGYSE